MSAYVHGFCDPRLPTRVEAPPSGPMWLHEIKRDGYRLMVRRDGGARACSLVMATTGPRATSDVRSTPGALVVIFVGRAR